MPFPYYGGYAYPDYGYGSGEPPEAIEEEPDEPYGGLSFDIVPPTAQVYVDGMAAGEADYFTPDAQPLAVGVGEHRIEIYAPGYEPMAFTVDVQPGEVIPFQGAREPY